MVLVVALIFVKYLVVPGFLIISLWTGSFASKASWLVSTLGSAAYIAYIVLTGAWDWVSYYLRVGLPVAFLGAADGLPDENAPHPDPENPAGNHVVVRCAQQGVDVLLAHVMNGSVAVKPGQSVEVGQFLGRVGNSGNSSEPHLHIHAVKTGSGSVLDGEGVPIRFDGRFLVRNSLVLRQRRPPPEIAPVVQEP